VAHLQGGWPAAVFYSLGNPMPYAYDQVHGVPLHNKLCERVFGLWDWLQRSRPNITTLAVEAYTLYAINHTSTWLEGLEPAERNRVITEARHDTNALRSKFKERQNAIRVEREAIFEAQKEAAQRKEQQQYQALYELSEKVEIQGGLWKKEEDVDTAIEKIEESGRGKCLGKKLEAVKTQMLFRKLVLK
jgi:hypothetical protein